MKMKSLLHVVALSVLALLLDGTGQAFACSCVQPAGPPCGVTAGSAVFVGAVVEATDVTGAPNGINGRRKFVFRVEETFSGITGTRVEVFSDTTSCGVDFALGQSYLVDGRQSNDGEISVHACSFTELASDAPSEIQILRKIKAAEPHLGIFGQLIEFRKPGENSLPTDPDLWRPLAGVGVVISSTTATRRMTTDRTGRFAVWDLPQGVYHVTVELKPPLKLENYSRGFHQQNSDPSRIDLRDCSARVSLIARGWGP
jgi:hypothetical protein